MPRAADISQQPPTAHQNPPRCPPTVATCAAKDAVPAGELLHLKGAVPAGELLHLKGAVPTGEPLHLKFMQFESTAPRKSLHPNAAV
eukprot:149165-Chlamydomonas_euryale.AAC.6